VCKKLIKNSQPFGNKFQKTAGGDFFDSHCIYTSNQKTTRTPAIANKSPVRRLQAILGVNYQQNSNVCLIPLQRCNAEKQFDQVFSNGSQRKVREMSGFHRSGRDVAPYRQYCHKPAGSSHEQHTALLLDTKNNNFSRAYYKRSKLKWMSSVVDMSLWSDTVGYVYTHLYRSMLSACTSSMAEASRVVVRRKAVAEWYMDASFRSSCMRKWDVLTLRVSGRRDHTRDRRRVNTILTLWCPLLPYGYRYKASCHHVPNWVMPSFVIFLHPGTLTISTERQSARMSKITTRSDTRCFIAVPIWQQWASKG